MAWLGVYILTFNCARSPVDADLFAPHLFDALPSQATTSSSLPEILVLSLQELAPLSYAFLGGSLLEHYYNAFRSAVKQAAGDERYQNVLTRNVGMTAIMVFVRDDVADKVSWVEAAEVGVGIQEVGNKGAVGARLGYLVADRSGGGRQTVGLTFVAAHLAPDEYAVERRNEDWENISRCLVFRSVDGGTRARMSASGETSPVDEAGEEGLPLLDSRAPADEGRLSSHLYAPGSYIFLAGDFNYRTSNERPQADDFMRFPQPTDDATSERHWSHLLAHDQLTQELRAHRTLHNLTEPPIEFPPTYKYALGVPRGGLEGEWNWARNRWPSWCDRILYTDNNNGNNSAAASTEASTSDNNNNEIGQIVAHKYDSLPLFPTSDHRPVGLSASVALKAATEPAGVAASVFEIDSNWESRRAAARRKEILAGVTAYGLFTWEGNAVLLATCVGVSAGYFALRAYLLSG